MNKSQDPNQLASDHTEYIEELLEAHDEPEDVKRMILFHYKSAFIHGFKHGVEAVEDRMRNHNKKTEILKKISEQ